MADEEKVVNPEEGQPQTEEATPEEGQSQTEDTQDTKGKNEPFYQTKYQELVSKLKQFENVGGQDYTPPATNEIPNQPDIQLDGGDDYITKADMQKMLNEVVSGVATKTAAQLRHEQMQERYNNEYNTVKQSLDEYINTSGAPQEVVNQAHQMAQDLVPSVNGLGGPSRYAKAFSYVMNNLMSGHKVNEQISQAKSEAEQKALQAKLTMQPDGSAAGMTEVPDLTDEEKILESMKAIGGNDAEKELFS